MYNNKFYQKTNKIRSFLLLYIDNELQKEKKNFSNKNKLFNQNPLKEEAFKISLEDEFFSNEEEKSSFYCELEKSDKKNNLYCWGNYSKSIFDLNQSSSTCEITPNKKLINCHKFIYDPSPRNNYKRNTDPDKPILSTQNLYSIPERGMKKVNSLSTNLCKYGLTPEINRSNTFKNKRKDNHDKEYLINLCRHLKIMKKKTNMHTLLKSVKENHKFKKKIQMTKSKKSNCGFLFNHKKASTNLIKMNNCNIDSLSPVKNHKKRSSIIKFYKNSTFSSSVSCKLQNSSKLKESKKSKKVNIQEKPQKN